MNQGSDDSAYGGSPEDATSSATFFATARAARRAMRKSILSFTKTFQGYKVGRVIKDALVLLDAECGSVKFVPFQIDKRFLTASHTFRYCDNVHLANCLSMFCLNLELRPYASAPISELSSASRMTQAAVPHAPSLHASPLDDPDIAIVIDPRVKTG